MGANFRINGHGPFWRNFVFLFSYAPTPPCFSCKCLQGESRLVAVEWGTPANSYLLLDCELAVLMSNSIEENKYALILVGKLGKCATGTCVEEKWPLCQETGQELELRSSIVVASHPVASLQPHKVLRSSKISKWAVRSVRVAKLYLPHDRGDKRETWTL